MALATQQVSVHQKVAQLMETVQLDLEYVVHLRKY